MDLPRRRRRVSAASTQIPDTEEQVCCTMRRVPAEASFSTICRGDSDVGFAPQPREDEASAHAEAVAEGSGLPSAAKEGARSPFEISAVPELKPLVWDPGSCSKELMLSDDGRVVTQTGSAKGLHGTLCSRADVDSFKVRIRYWSRVGCLFVGFACLGKSPAKRETRYDGLFLRCVNGRFWTAFDDEESTYCGVLSMHDVIEVVLDRASSRIAFLVNGDERVGAEFVSMSYKLADLFPCTQLGSHNAIVELV